MPELFTSSFSTCSRILNDEPSTPYWNMCPIGTTTCIWWPSTKWAHVCIGWLAKVGSCEAVPNNWSEAVLLPQLKKGDKRTCSNYRRISFIDITAKVFGVILLKRFQPKRDQRTRPNQSGFRPGRGYTDQMLNLRRIQEKRWRFQQATVMWFIDFGGGWNAPKLLRRTIRRPRWRLGQVGVAQCLLGSATAFDKGSLSLIPSSVT